MIKISVKIYSLNDFANLIALSAFEKIFSAHSQNNYLLVITNDDINLAQQRCHHL